LSISDQIEEFLINYETFELSNETYPLLLEGVLDVTGPKGKLYDRFHISIEISEKYPKSLPKVKELDSRIPRIADRHINPDSSCCLCLPIAEDIFIKNGFELIEFYESLVVPFFANQVYYEKTDNWAVGEFAHGRKGMRQFYKDAFQTNDERVIVYGLRISLGWYSPPFDCMTCFCGSKHPYIICHKLTIEIFKMIGREIIVNDLKKISDR